MAAGAINSRLLCSNVLSNTKVTFSSCDKQGFVFRSKHRKTEKINASISPAN